MAKKHDNIQRIFELVARLRGEDGCPWDREQTLKEVLSDIIEEAYELEWAARKRPDELFEEMGDVLFLLCFAIAVQHETDPGFTIDRVAGYAHDKIYHRHPHVFGDANAATPEQSIAIWEEVKAGERADKSGNNDIFDGVAGNMPPIRYAEKIQERAASVGFDWDNPSGIIDKLREEIDELEISVRNKSRKQIEEETGDLLFSVINMTRFLNIDASGALNGTTEKFVKRFRVMEDGIRADGKSLDKMTLEEMDVYWERAKTQE